MKYDYAIVFGLVCAMLLAMLLIWYSYGQKIDMVERQIENVHAERPNK